MSFDVETAMFCLVRDIYTPTALAGCVATIGTYDGIHIGHQAVLRHLCDQGNILQLPTAVVLFEPQPNEYFRKGKPEARLTTLREKLMLLKRLGINYVFCMRFNEQLASLSAETFVAKVLIEQLKAVYVVVGEHCIFGSRGAGDFPLLKECMQRNHLQAEQMMAINFAGERVSSTRIRAALANSDFRLANSLLGRPYAISGKVAYGDHRGHTLGFPTANIYLRHRAVPINGVFVAKVHGLGKAPLISVANIGVRPTFAGHKLVLEVHILNFDDDIYGKRIEVEFCAKLRDEVKFDSMMNLRQQIMQDCERALQNQEG